MRRWPPPLIVVAFVAIWAFKGAHRGFTRDSEFVESLDPVTGITKVEVVRVWTPGLDFLLMGVLAALCVWLALRFTKETR